MKEPVVVADVACVCGEGPFWHPGEKRLYWVDIPKGLLLQYDPAERSHRTVWQGRPMGGFTLQDDGSMLLFLDKGGLGLWRDGLFELVRDALPDEEKTRFNDVIADPRGGVFCGTMPVGKERLGRLYYLNTDGTTTKLLEGIGCSNGLGFSPDLRTMYYTDSPKREIYTFDYDPATGAATDQRVWVRTREEDGVPDGMTVDAEGFVWSAHWNGSCIFRYDPEGRLERKIDLPVQRVTSLTFGGDDGTDIYITTAGGDAREKCGAMSGSLFHMNAGIKGRPEFASKVRFAAPHPANPGLAGD